MPLALLIWGAIFYKIYMASRDNNASPVQPTLSTFEKSNSKLDIFSLIADYPDPFLKRTNYTVKRVAQQPRKEQNKKQKSEKKEKAPINWPTITFSGTIANKDTKQQLVMLVVNGTNHLMRQNEQKSDLQLLEIRSDSILVRYMGEEKFIRKQS